jgi:hypothetical protein
MKIEPVTLFEHLNGELFPFRVCFCSIKVIRECSLIEFSRIDFRLPSSEPAWRD